LDLLHTDLEINLSYPWDEATSANLIDAQALWPCYDAPMYIYWICGVPEQSLA